LDIIVTIKKVRNLLESQLMGISGLVSLEKKPSTLVKILLIIKRQPKLSIKLQT